MRHDLSPELAKKAAEKAFEAYRARYAKYNPSLAWLSESKAEASFNAKGVTMRGVLELKPGAIEFDLDVPFVLRLFKKRAMEIMDRELRVWTEKAKAGEL